jgi:hypothetical protein
VVEKKSLNNSKNKPDRIYPIYLCLYNLSNGKSRVPEIGIAGDDGGFGEQ